MHKRKEPKRKRKALVRCALTTQWHFRVTSRNQKVEGSQKGGENGRHLLCCQQKSKLKKK